MFSSYERMFVSLTLRFRLLIGQNMDNLITKTTLWSDCPLENVSQGRDDWRPSTLVSSSFRRPYTELGISLYVLRELMSTTYLYLIGTVTNL
jgi:hypothetical protein